MLQVWACIRSSPTRSGVMTVEGTIDTSELACLEIQGRDPGHNQAACQERADGLLYIRWSTPVWGWHGQEGSRHGRPWCHNHVPCSSRCTHRFAWNLVCQYVAVTSHSQTCHVQAVLAPWALSTSIAVYRRVDFSCLGEAQPGWGPLVHLRSISCGVVRGVCVGCPGSVGLA